MMHDQGRSSSKAMSFRAVSNDMTTIRRSPPSEGTMNDAATVLTDVEPTHLEVTEHFTSLTLSADIHANLEVCPLTVLSVYIGDYTQWHVPSQIRAPSCQRPSLAR